MSKNKTNQENQVMEWKWSWRDEYLKWLAGYANTDGGTLYIGVNDDGYVVGLKDAKSLLESLPNKISDKTGILASINIFSVYGAENIRYGKSVPKDIAQKIINRYACGEVSTKNMDKGDNYYSELCKYEQENKIWENKDGEREYLSIEIIRYPFAVSYDGKYYKRSGSTLKLLTGLELQKFLLEKSGISWDAMSIPGIDVTDLSIEALNVFRKKAVDSKRMTPAEVDISNELLLHNLQLYNANNLTRAALLMFHPDPEQFATGAYIKLGYFAPVRAGQNGEKPIEDLLYQDTVRGPLIMQVDKAIELIFTKYFKFLIDYKGIQRVETPMLSRDMVREILLNAVNHKDYASGVPIQVKIYEDHMDVFNMGDWPERVPSDDNIYGQHESVPYNPKIANVSFRSGDVEGWGRGYLKIKSECDEIEAPLPVIDARAGGVSVKADGCKEYMRLLRYGQYGQVGADGVWRKGNGDDNDDDDLIVPNVQLESKEEPLKEPKEEPLKEPKEEPLKEKVMKLMRENPRITYDKMAEELGVSRSSIKRAIGELEKFGVIRRLGGRKYGHWEIVDYSLEAEIE